MISFEIENRIYEFNENDVLLKSLLENGFEIPHLCYVDGLNFGGSCGLCIIEIPEIAEILRSCEYQAWEIAEKISIARSKKTQQNLELVNVIEKTDETSEPIKIELNSKQIKQRRSDILKLIARTHPAECTFCDKWGECNLAKYIAHEVSEKPENPVRSKSQFTDFSENIRFSNARCIKCGLCIAFEREKLGSDKINWFGWGDMLQPFVKDNDQLASGFDLNLLDICPTGALERKFGVYPVPMWKFETVRTNCLSCPKLCEVSLLTHNNQAFDFRQPEPGLKNLFCNDARQELVEQNNHRFSKPIYGLRNIADSNEALQKSANILTEQNRKAALIVTGSLFNEELEQADLLADQLDIPLHLRVNLLNESEPLQLKSQLYRSSILGFNPFAPAKYNFEEYLDIADLFNFLQANEINSAVILNPDFVLNTEISEVLQPFLSRNLEKNGLKNFVLMFSAIKSINKNSRKELMQIPVAGRYERSGKIFKIEYDQLLQKQADNDDFQVDNYSEILIEKALQAFSGVEPLEFILNNFRGIYQNTKKHEFT